MQTLHKEIKNAKILKLYKYFNHFNIVYKKNCLHINRLFCISEHESSYRSWIKSLPTYVASHERAPRYDLTVTHDTWCVCMCVRKMRGKAAPVQAAPMESTKREEERRCVFTRLGFWAGRGTRGETESRARQGSRKSSQRVSQLWSINALRSIAPLIVPASLYL